MPDSRVVVRAAFLEIEIGLPFTDVAEGDWFYNAVKYVYENDLFKGMSNTSFGPQEPMNRAMLVTVLYRLAGEPAVSESNRFSDVANGQWYSDAVVWADANGIVEGYAGDVFKPLQDISREEIATIICRYAAYKGEDVSARADMSKFVDGDKIADWAADSFSWAVAEKVMQGKGVNNLDPQVDSTRAEVAQILMNYLVK